MRLRIKATIKEDKDLNTSSIEEAVKYALRIIRKDGGYERGDPGISVVRCFLKEMGRTDLKGLTKAWETATGLKA